MSPTPTNMPKLIPDDLTTVEFDSARANQKVIDVIADLDDAIEGVFRKHGVTYADYEQFRQMNIKLGPLNMIGIFDIWMVPLLDRIHHEGRVGTSENPSGPFYVPGAPVLEPPYALARNPDEPGDPLIVSGSVTATDGRPLAGAVLDIWHCNAVGFYSNFGMSPTMEDWDFRGKVPCDDEGRFGFTTIKPPPYTSLTEAALDDPYVAIDFFHALGRSKYRPAHIHIMIEQPELGDPYVTQLYFSDDPYVEYDVGAAVKGDLVTQPVLHTAPSDLEAAGLDRPFYTVEFDFELPAAAPASTGA